MKPLLCQVPRPTKALTAGKSYIVFSGCAYLGNIAAIASLDPPQIGGFIAVAAGRPEVGMRVVETPGFQLSVDGINTSIMNFKGT